MPWLLHLLVWVVTLCLYVLLVREAKLSFPRHREHLRIQKLAEWGCCRSPQGMARESVNNSGLKVILPSTGQTGTTSVAQALRDLGYKTYHIEEKDTFLVPVMWKDTNAQSFARATSRCGIEVLSLEPSWDSMAVAFKASPDAKVIMTWRPFDAWSGSANGYTGFLVPFTFKNRDDRWAFIRLHLAMSCAILPWLDVYDALTGQVRHFLATGAEFAGIGQVTLWGTFLRNFLRLYDHQRNRVFSRGVFKFAGSEEAYLMHIDEIRRRVPQGRLLEFNVKKHGWKELAEFLGVPGKPSDLPFPHPRSKNDWTNDALYVHRPAAYLMAFSIYSQLHLVNFVIFHVLACATTEAFVQCLRGPHDKKLVATSALCCFGVICLASRVVRVIHGGEPYDMPPLLPVRGR